MAQNPLPIPPGALIVLAGKCKAGLNSYQTPLGITQVTVTTLTTEIAALNGAISAFNGSRTLRTAASKTLIAASAAAKKFLGDARGLFASHWGEDYSLQWAQAGWTDNSTAVPGTQPARLALVTAIEAYLTENPEMEVNVVALNVTAARAASVRAAFQGALDGVDGADSQSAQIRQDRADADHALRRSLRALISILNQKLTPNDPRWAAFGLHAPGAATTPKAPKHLASHPALAGQIYVTCSTPAGTDHFRWYVQGPGDADFVFKEDTADAEWLATGQPHGQTVLVRVTAVNAAGESVPSEAVSVAVS